MALSELATPLLSLTRAIWPRLRVLYAERKAGSAPINNGDLLDRLLNDTYERISSPTIEDSWWRRLLERAQHAYVAPEFLRFPHLQEWLRVSGVREDLLRLARHEVLGLARPADAEANLAQTYSNTTGEDSRRARGPVDVVIAILAAGVLARLDEGNFAATALFMARFDQLEDELGNRIDSAGTLSGYVTELISTAASDRLNAILVRRAVAVDRARDAIKELADEVTSGDLAGVQAKTKARVLYWASRLYAGEPELLSQARVFLTLALEHDEQLDARIPRALMLDSGGDLAGAIALLRDGDTADDRSALFGLICRRQGDRDALEWFDQQVGVEDVNFATGLGWHVIAVRLFLAGRYSEALSRLSSARPLWSECPLLALVEGLMCSAMLLPEEHRAEGLDSAYLHLPFALAEGHEAEGFRRRARETLTQAEQLLLRLDLREQARAARDALLWLRLTDSDVAVASAAREGLKQVMSDPPTAVELIRFARLVNLDFDASPLRNYLAQRRRWGGLSGMEVVAEFLLSDFVMSSRERAEFIRTEESRLAEEIGVPTLLAFRVDALIEAGEYTPARNLLNERRSDFSPGDFERLLAQLTTREGGDPRSILESAYARGRGLVDLHNLCRYLWHAKDWEALRPLLRELLKREKTVENATKLVICIRRDGRGGSKQILEALSEVDDLLAKSDNILSEKAWALFSDGDSGSAKRLNDLLIARREAKADLMLDTNIALQSGDWERFAAIVEREWPRRKDLDADALMRLATLAAEGDSSGDRSIQLAREAAAKEPTNPATLISAYALGFQLGREHDVDPEWLIRAVALSTSEGPVWKVDMKTLVEEMVPAHHERARRVEEDLLGGAMPLRAAARGLNMPLARLLLQIPKANSLVHDGRQRTIVPIVSGGRAPVEVQAHWQVAFDTTALFVLDSLDLLPLVLDTFHSVLLPSDVMLELLNERRRVLFHQPSLVTHAQQLRDFIDGGLIRTTPPVSAVPPWLTAEVGRDLAELLELAKVTGGRVVRPLPIPKLASFMEREANLAEYGDVVLSCTQFVATLKDNGHIDSATSARALKYLTQHDRSPAVPLERQSILGPLYLDDLAVTYLRSSGILQICAKLGLDLYVHHTSPQETSDISRASREGAELGEQLNRLRIRLKDALESGKARFFSPSEGVLDDEEETALSALFPALSQLLMDTRGVDAVCIDDRFFNQHAAFTDRTGHAATTIALPDVIRFLAARGALSEQEARAIRHRARRAGYVFVPLEPSELDAYIKQSAVRDGELVETDELRVLRQSLMRVRSLVALVQPLETRFLDTLRLTCLTTMRQVWADENMTVDDVEVRCTWIWNNLAPLPFAWARTIRDGAAVMSPHDAFAQYVAMLVLPMFSSERDRHSRFVAWCEEVALKSFSLVDTSLLDDITAQVSAALAKVLGKSGLNSEQELTSYVLEALPDEVRQRLHKVPWIERALHVSTRYVMHIGGWASVDAHGLFSAVSMLFASGRNETLFSVAGEVLHVELSDDAIEVRHVDEKSPEKRAKLRELMLLSSVREQRLSAWTEVSHRLGPAIPAAFDALATALAASSIDEADLMAVLQELGSGVNALHKRAKLAMRDGQPSLEQLVPTSPDYYVAFCGPFPETETVDDYVTTALCAHRRQLIAREHVQGLDICVIGGLRVDLSPIGWVEDISNDDLWNALGSINPNRDPFSLVNALELALARVSDVRFEQFARSAVEKLTASTFNCGGHDGYELLPLLSTLVLDQLNNVAGLNTRQPFWKRMCAWMHGAVLLRIVQDYALNVAELSRWVNSCRSMSALFTRSRDLRSEPMYRAVDMSRKALVAEVTGRLELLVQKQPAACAKVGLTEALLEVERKLSETDPFGWLMCGPLEGQRLPRDAGRKLSEHDVSASLDMIEKREFEHMWFGLSTMSQLCDLTEPVLQKATEHTIAIMERTRSGELTLAGLSYAALVAAAHRDTRLASTVANGVCIALADSDDADDIGEAVQIILLAAAANAGQAAWQAWVEQQLAMLCARVPRSSQCSQLLPLLRGLQTVLSCEQSPVYRGEGIANSGA